MIARTICRIRGHRLAYIITGARVLQGGRVEITSHRWDCQRCGLKAAA